MDRFALNAIEHFFRRWGVSYEEMCRTFHDGFVDGGEWIAGPGIPATRTPEAAVALMAGFRAACGMDTVEVLISRIAQSGDTVWTERVDTVIDAQGRRVISLPVVGVMDVDSQGLIVRWTDYWDMREFEKLTATLART